jgi:hypothetical protein
MPCFQQELLLLLLIALKAAVFVGEAVVVALAVVVAKGGKGSIGRYGSSEIDSFSCCHLRSAYNETSGIIDAHRAVRREPAQRPSY